MKIEHANTCCENRNPQQKQNKWYRWQFLKMHPSRFSELTGYEVSHGCFQHHHHRSLHHHRRQHHRYAVHNLFQSDPILRIPEEVCFVSTWPSFFLWLRWSSPRGIQVIATCRNNTWTMRPTFLLLSNDQHRCFITHCLHRRRAPLVRPHCTTDHHGLEVVSTLPR